jgi:tetratricopeptide (TPR) repeat protein
VGFLPEERARSASETSTLATPQRFGDFDLLDEIGRGGMGVIYKARQVGLNRTVALKMILGGHLAAPDEIRRFRAEAEAAASLKHPNIVAIHEVGGHQGQHYFSMDFIAGRSLAAAMRDGPWPVEQAARCVQTIAKAVHFAHQQGLLHRDLKPSNVLLDHDGQPHITDFGLARRIAGTSELTLTGQVLGTPSYMSPEQASAKPNALGPGTDVYSLGAILYELLTGRPPFAAATPHETLNQVLTAEPVAVRLLNPAVPRDLETICLKCLDKEPARRYESSLALAQDIGRYLIHEAICALPPSAVYRARKFARRHRMGVAVSAAFVLLMGLATAISIQFGIRANREKATAFKAKEAASKAGVAARKKAAEATAVLDFLRDYVLAAARPEGLEGGLGYDVTLRQAVQAAEPRIAQLFTNQAFVEFDIRHALGLTFMHLDDFTNASRQFQRTTALAEEMFGPTDAIALAEPTFLAGAHLRAGHTAEAVSLFEQNLRSRRAASLTNGESLLKATEGLASAYAQAGRYSEALPLFLQVVDWGTAKFGPIDEGTIKSLANLAGLYGELGQTDNSLKRYQQVFDWYRTNLAPAHPETITAMHNLASAYERSGQYQQALSLFEPALAMSRTKLGPTNTLTLNMLNSLGLAYRRTRQWDRAIACFKEAWEGHAARYGQDHPNSITMLDNLASAYQYADRAAEALPLHERVVALSKANSGDNHPATLTAMNNLAETYRLLGRLNDALPLYESALDRMRKLPIVNTNEFAALLENLVPVYVVTNRLDDAMLLCRELLDLRPLRSPADNLLTAGVILEAGYACLVQHKYSEAEPLLLGVLSIRREYEPGRSAVFTVQGYLARSLLGQRRYEEAESQFQEAYAGLTAREAASPEPSRARFIDDIAQGLAQLYQAWGKPELAVEWRQKASSARSSSSLKN